MFRAQARHVCFERRPFLSDEGPALETLALYYPYRQYTNFFLFRFVSEHCLRSTLRLFHCKLEVCWPALVAVAACLCMRKESTFCYRLQGPGAHIYFFTRGTKKDIWGTKTRQLLYDFVSFCVHENVMIWYDNINLIYRYFAIVYFCCSRFYV